MHTILKGRQIYKIYLYNGSHPQRSQMDMVHSQLYYHMSHQGSSLEYTDQVGSGRILLYSCLRKYTQQSVNQKNIFRRLANSVPNNITMNCILLLYTHIYIQYTNKLVFLLNILWELIFHISTLERYLERYYANVFFVTYSCFLFALSVQFFCLFLFIILLL